MTTLRRLHRPVNEQARLFLDPGRDDGPPLTAGAVCEAAEVTGSRVVHLCGERPGGDSDGFAAWRACDLGQWEPRPEGHYLRDLLTPVLRYRRPEGPSVDVRSVGEWFGDHTDATPSEAAQAFDIMREVLAVRVEGSILWASPQATGTDLLLRCLPAGREWRALPAEVQDHIRSTATQGRTEMWPAFGRVTTEVPGRIPRLVEYDGRFMYAALAGDLPEGEPTEGNGWPEPEALGYLPGTEPVMVRGRYLVEWRAPKDWAHVGILPHLGANGWDWPVPRRWVRGWVDGAELLVATRWGWEVKVRRHLAWPRCASGGPLSNWAKRMVSARNHALLLGDSRAHHLAAAGLRAMVLTTIGVLHGRAHADTRTWPLSEPLPAGPKRRLRTEGQVWVWEQDPKEVKAARPEFSHPEWSSAIWARCRARLLDARAPGGFRTGALHVDPASIVAFSMDALYLTDDPGWPDDGAVGRLRRQGDYPGPLDAPPDRSALLALLRRMRA